MTLRRVVATDAHEGPVYVPEEDALYFTTVPRPANGRGPRVDIRRLALDGERFPLGPERLSTLRADANVANGMTLDAAGRLVVCEQGSRERPAAVTRVDRRDGRAQTIADAWRGLPLNSPNDVVVKGDGTVWFTDPSYGHVQGFRPEPQRADAVLRCDPCAGRVEVVAEGFEKPNGLAFSPGERVLYVGDSEACHVKAFDVEDGARLSGGRVLAEIAPGHPDGLKVDAAGRIHVSAGDGVHVLAPDGERLRTIPLPGAVNFTFGGPEGDVLFITADDAIWAAVPDRPAHRPTGA
jgi:gluconolactonase